MNYLMNHQSDRFLFWKMIIQGAKDPLYRYQWIARLTPLGSSTHLILGSCLFVGWENKYFDVLISIGLNYSSILFYYFTFYFFILFSFIVFFVLFPFILLQMNIKLQSISFTVRSKKCNLNIFLFISFFYLSEKGRIFFLFFCKFNTILNNRRL